MVIDVYSKYGWIKSLRDKKGETVTEAFRSNFKEGRQPQYLRFGKGKEFYNKQLKESFDKYGITIYSTENDEKLSVVERCNRTKNGEFGNSSQFTATHSILTYCHK